METKIIKDEALKDSILNNVGNEISQLHEKYHKVPGIAFVGFMGVPLGKYNIPFHVNLAQQLGFQVFNETQPDNITEAELFKAIDKLNDNDDIHAIVLLQPLPEHLNPLRIVNRIRHDKEMEGFHPKNMMNTLFPDIADNDQPMCLPAALYEIFKNNNIPVTKDKEWLLVIDDEFFSNPLVNMISRTAFIKAVPADNILTTMNKDSDKLDAYIKKADFLVVVTQDPEYVKPEWLKEGVFIIDIYSNLVKEVPSKKNPDMLVPVIRGGVNAESVQNIASGILPVPGGLMPVVLAILFRNTVNSFKKGLGEI